MSVIIRGAFVREALQESINKAKGKGLEFGYQCIEDYFLDLCEDVGVDSDELPSFYVDNAIVNGSYGYYKDFFETEEEAFKAYENGELLFCDYDENTNKLIVIFNF